MFVSGPETRCPSSKRNPSGRYHQQRAIALAQEAQYPARIVDQPCEHEPPRMTIFPNGLRGLEQMFNLVRSVSGSLSSTSILRNPAASQILFSSYSGRNIPSSSP